MDATSTVNSGQLKRAKKRAERRQRAYDAALKTMMRSPDGARVLWALLGWSGLERTVVADGYETNRVLFMAGVHSFGVMLKADMVRVDLEGYVALEAAMRAEQAKEEREEQAARTPSVKAGQADTGGTDE